MANRQRKVCCLLLNYYFKNSSNICNGIAYSYTNISLIIVSLFLSKSTHAVRNVSASVSQIKRPTQVGLFIYTYIESKIRIIYGVRGL